MALRLAVGSYRPLVVPGVYLSPGIALIAAKIAFAKLLFKCPISVWDTSKSWGVVDGTLVDWIEPFTYRGERIREDEYTYPDGEDFFSEPDTGTPANLSAVETLQLLNTKTTDNNEKFFGPFPVDNEYRLDSCADTLSVYDDIDADGNETRDDLAEGPPYSNPPHKFNWKYRAVPRGGSSDGVPWSGNEGPEHTFDGLIPGLTYDVQVTDFDEDLEP